MIPAPEGATDRRRPSKTFCRHCRGSGAPQQTCSHGFRRGPHYVAAAAAGDRAYKFWLALCLPSACGADWKLPQGAPRCPAALRNLTLRPVPREQLLFQFIPLLAIVGQRGEVFHFRRIVAQVKQFVEVIHVVAVFVAALANHGAGVFGF